MGYARHGKALADHDNSHIYELEGDTPATGNPSQIWNGPDALDGIHGPSGNALALGNGLAALARPTPAEGMRGRETARRPRP